MLILLATLLSPVFAQESRNLYQDNNALTEGVLEDFRELYVDAATFASQVSPKQAADGTGKLVIYNRTSSPMDLHVNGVKVGMLHPATPAIIHGLSAGTYEVSLTSLNAYTSTSMVATVDESAPITEMTQAKTQSVERPSTLVSVPLPPPVVFCFTPQDSEELECEQSCPAEAECSEVLKSECGAPCGDESAPAETPQSTIKGGR